MPQRGFESGDCKLYFTHLKESIKKFNFILVLFFSFSWYINIIILLHKKRSYNIKIIDSEYLNFSIGWRFL